ncbi:uncharacterized protein [Gossypium hirsutum]|uniref:CCHC-type domain-containing protein n=1 Tax=Gossypium hirsutum TaxID=3635 RepID=A0A1U8HNG0_GOSHI|nr:uncharacterized protein LOC107887851 [Gossypium hirsutum]
MTLEFFQEEFRKKYISQRFMDQKRKKFLELKQEFVVLVERACKAEELAKEKRKADLVSRDLKKRQLSKSFQSSSKKSREFTTRSNASTGLGCPQCERCHFGECQGNDRTCFKCVSPDHFVRDCPERTKRRNLQGTRSDSTANKGKPQRNLGSGTSSKSAPKESAMRPEGRAPARTYAIRVTKRPRLLIMDWLTTHDVVVNCGRKSIEQNCENRNVLQVEPDELNGMHAVISFMSTQRCIRKGNEAYLTFVLNIKESNLKIESVPVVCEYLDVFLEELPGLPPIREVDFGINFTAGTVPISIAPYRMAPTKLKELKVQLQELTDKGFVRPSFSS